MANAPANAPSIGRSSPARRGHRRAGDRTDMGQPPRLRELTRLGGLFGPGEARRNDDRDDSADEGHRHGNVGERDALLERPEVAPEGDEGCEPEGRCERKPHPGRAPSASRRRRRGVERGAHGRACKCTDKHRGGSVQRSEEPPPRHARQHGGARSTADRTWRRRLHRHRRWKGQTAYLMARGVRERPRVRGARRLRWRARSSSRIDRAPARRR